MSGSYKILDTSQKKEWSYYHNLLPDEQQDINFCADYYEIYEKSGYGKAQCFVLQEDDKVIIYPYLLNSVNNLELIETDEEYFDIQGAYGFNGAVSNTTDPDFINKFNRCFLDYCKSNNIIAEFIRFNPLLRNEKYMNYIKPISTNDVVVLDLEESLQDIWKYSFESATRNAIKKAQKNDLDFFVVEGDKVTEKHVADFVSIYHATMSKNNASLFYYFSKEFFFEILQSLGAKASLCFVMKDEVPISTALHLHYKDRVYGLLAGTVAAYYKYQPFSFLLYKTIKYFKEKGYKKDIIGGGLKRGDNIYKFKKSFARKGSYEFFIGKKVHNEEIYQKLCSAWEQKYPNLKDNYKNFLLKYREKN